MSPTIPSDDGLGGYEPERGRMRLFPMCHPDGDVRVVYLEGDGVRAEMWIECARCGRPLVAIGIVSWILPASGHGLIVTQPGVRSPESPDVRAVLRRDP